MPLNKALRGIKVQCSLVAFVASYDRVCFRGVLLVRQRCSHCQKAHGLCALTCRGRVGSCRCVTVSGPRPMELLNSKRHLCWHLPLLFYISNPSLAKAYKLLSTDPFTAKVPFILLENDNTWLVFSFYGITSLVVAKIRAWGCSDTILFFLGVIPGTKPGYIVLKVMVFYLFDCGVTPASGHLLFCCEEI